MEDNLVKWLSKVMMRWLNGLDEFLMDLVERCDGLSWSSYLTGSLCTKRTRWRKKNGTGANDQRAVQGEPSLIIAWCNLRRYALLVCC